MSRNIGKPGFELTRREFLAAAAGAASTAGAAERTWAGDTPLADGALRPVRLAVVGGGFGATFPFRGRSDIVVTAACDPDPAARDRLRRAYRPAVLCERFDQLLALPEVDAVAVFSPGPLRATMAARAAAYGRHVLCGTPIATTPDALRYVKDTVDRADVNLMLADIAAMKGGILADTVRASGAPIGPVVGTQWNIPASDASDMRRFLLPPLAFHFALGDPPCDVAVHSASARRARLLAAEIRCESGAIARVTAADPSFDHNQPFAQITGRDATPVEAAAPSPIEATDAIVAEFANAVRTGRTPRLDLEYAAAVMQLTSVTN
jgi:predicted dehydrogenase